MIGRRKEAGGRMRKAGGYRSGRSSLACSQLRIASLFLACMAIASCSMAGPPSDRASAEFRAHLASPTRDAWLENDATSWMGALSPKDAAAVGELALADSSAGVRIFGTQVLFERVSEARGASAAADMIVRGDDVTPLMWSWLHARDPSMAERRLALIRGELESRKGRLTPEQRQRVDKLLCPGGSGCR